jgi:hypothetical protein
MTSSFTKLVNEYNEDYVALLQRASKGNYQRLLFSFRVLKDLYDVIQLLFDKRAWGPQVFTLSVLVSRQSESSQNPGI